MPDLSFNYLTAEKTELYRAVMDTFSEAKAQFVVHLRPEDVLLRAERKGRRSELEAVQAALAQLVEWGNLEAEPDTGRVTTVEDFYRARYLYRITREGEAAEAALATYHRMLGHRGALQSVALADIAAQLRALLALLDAPAEGDGAGRPDPAKAHLLLRDITRVSAELADNARDFMAGLARGTDLRLAGRDAFVAYKDRLLDYLRRFIGDLVTRSAEIAGLIEAIGSHPGFADLLQGVAEREAADLAPVPELGLEVDSEPESDGDLAPDPDRAERRDGIPIDPEWAQARSLALWQSRWDGLADWFIGAPDRSSQAELLRARARRAISDLLDAIVQLNERRLGRSDRSADFRTLAAWFLECEDEADAHRLWRAAFGLGPARHLGIDSDTLVAREERPIPPDRPWAEAPPLAISPRLRETGRYRRAGAAPKVRDRGADKRRLQGLLAREGLEARNARRLLATGEETRLSRIGTLDATAFALFLRLLGEALATGGRPDEPLETVTGDGTLRIELTPLGPETRARIETPDGTFGGRDYRVRITDLEQGAAGEASDPRPREPVPRESAV